MKRSIFRIIKIGYVDDGPSRAFDIVIAASILLNLFIIFFETFDASAKYLGVLGAIEFVTVVIFTIEYVLRIFTADLAYPSKGSYGLAVVAFVFSLYGIIDLLSFLPYWLAFIFPAAHIPAGAVAFRMLRVVRILRLFRINRYYDAFNVITDVLKEKKNQILSALFIILMLILASSIIMYDLEHDAQPEMFKNAFSGIWWGVSTLLTVGYGDIYPVTAAGRFVGIVLAFLGVGTVAIPTGIISAGFVQHYTKIKDLEGLIDERPLGFFTIRIGEDHAWLGKKLSDIKPVDGAGILGISRSGRILAPRADETVCVDDLVMAGSISYEDNDILIGEIEINGRSDRIGEAISDFESRFKVTCLLLKRNEEAFVPTPDTVIEKGDALIVSRRGLGGNM